MINTVGKSLQIPVVDGRVITHDAFKYDFFNQRLPVLLKYACADWDFITRWNPEYLITTLGDYECTVLSDSRPSYAKTKCLMKDFLSSSERLNTITMNSFDAINDDIPRFFDDLKFPNKFFEIENICMYLYFNCGERHGTLPHCHMDAFNLLQSGRKRWIMYEAHPDVSPIGWQLLKECHLQYGEGTHARDWFMEVGSNSLMAADVNVYEFEQEAGDIVYIPEHFAHGVLNLTDTQGLIIFAERPETPYLMAGNGYYSPRP